MESFILIYLPKVDNNIWSRHRSELYETTDGYLSKNDKITFLIEDETKMMLQRWVEVIMVSSLIFII